MIFLADIAFALELIALAIGTALLIYASREGSSFKKFGKIIAFFTIVASILAMFCTSYYSYRYWEDGFFNSPLTMINTNHMPNKMMNQAAPEDMHKNMMKMNSR